MRYTSFLYHSILGFNEIFNNIIEIIFRFIIKQVVRYMDIINYFDDRILGLIYAITLMGISLTFYMTYSLYRKPYMKQIVFALFFNSLGMLMIVSRDYVPVFISVILGNSILICTIYIVYDGMVRMIKGHTHIKLLIIISSVFPIIHLYFTYYNPNLTARILNFAIFDSFGALYLCTYYWKKLKWKTDYIISVIFGTHMVYIFVHCYRIYFTLVSTNQTNLFSGTSMLKYYFLYLIFLTITRVVCVTLYNTKDLV